MILIIDIIGIILIGGLLICCVCDMINNEKKYKQISNQIDKYFEDSL